MQTSTDVFTPLGDKAETVRAYFETFNQGQFLETSQLFAPTGCLHPPFEEPLQGPNAIAQYLEQEAAGMVADPIDAQATNLGVNEQKVTVKGKVTALVFKVTVVWDFILNSQNQLTSARINLVASLEELLHIRQPT